MAGTIERLASDGLARTELESAGIASPVAGCRPRETPLIGLEPSAILVGAGSKWHRVDRVAAQQNPDSRCGASIELQTVRTERGISSRDTGGAVTIPELQIETVITDVDAAYIL